MLSSQVVLVVKRRTSAGHGRDVGGGQLVQLPFLGEASVVVYNCRHPSAAAERTPAGFGSDDIGIGGLVVEVVATGIETASIIVGIFFESGAQIVVYPVVHMHAAKAVTLHMPLSEIGDGNGVCVAHAATDIYRYKHVVDTVAVAARNHAVQRNRVNAVGYQVKSDTSTIAGLHKSDVSHSLQLFFNVMP